MDSGDTPTTSSSMSGRGRPLRTEQGPSSESFSTKHTRQPSCKVAMYLEDAVFFPLTPPTSDPGPPAPLTSDLNNHRPGSNSHSDSDTELPMRKRRAPVPSEKKDDRYWERRKKNNIAAKRSRELRRKKVDEELKQAGEAIQENQKLKQEIEVLKAEINSLRRLLKDANMTLSLWIRAKQTAEPNTQLPPMLRGPNVPFVNFPVSSTV
ncbi:Cell death specification protein 2 [Geodia barretti]|uniref:Cell death specification protein 2 n=1 Tax=Geodia barretti TaxID=519541 RepID=A0AA35R0N7_GEOBA|nr:Cell death specification protein 2 [Geodia barretti]